ncbi:hypothetical protein HMPREF2580_10830 [Staphylococcus sp. HMSC036D05]|uniref:hypothetical protein n=1 Tax=Staphylococcus sp. HMSC036D05 TaxID=1715059 RepID=UPI0008AA427C|nr:hypothetical protein [Staphylococcus sp. HMSC036D05]OHO68035.1 hypothetical protein HMPREF2580_10830 [Staphylococcus sp. HMSC036D05]
MEITSLITLIVILGIGYLIINGIRKKSQQTFSEDKLDHIDHSGYGNGKYFYQAPSMILDNQYIPIYGKKRLCHIPYYKDSSQKMRSIFGLKPLHGTQVRSDDYSVIIERVEGITNFALYRVLLNGEEIGTFKKDKMIKEGGFNRLFPYSFVNKAKESYRFENPDRFHSTVIKDEHSNIILSAERTALDYKKSKKTNKRGEQNQIKVNNNSKYPDEVWLALYIQACITYQTLDKQ